jgi:hypothetical protein
MADARDHENDATMGSEKKKDGRWFTGGTPRRTHQREYNMIVKTRVSDPCVVNGYEKENVSFFVAH